MSMIWKGFFMVLVCFFCKGMRVTKNKAFPFFNLNGEDIVPPQPSNEKRMNSAEKRGE
jgi:hypothetical protein